VGSNPTLSATNYLYLFENKVIFIGSTFAVPNQVPKSAGRRVDENEVSSENRP
jgi:hypothetical protein